VATITTSQGVALDYEVTGSGPMLVLVHGITENRRTWDPLVAPLARDHTVVALDLRGHGRSGSGPSYDLASMAADVHDLVEAVGGGPPLLVGHSLGGTVVSAYAAAQPCRGVVNVDQPLALAGFQDALRQLEPLLRGDQASFEAAIDAVFESMAGALGAEQRARVSALRQARQDVVLAIWAPVLDLPAGALDAMVTSLGTAITAPYLSVHGIDPGPGYADWLAGVIHSAQVEVWPGRGHYPHLVEPERFQARLAAFEATLPAA